MSKRNKRQGKKPDKEGERQDMAANDLEEITGDEETKAPEDENLNKEPEEAKAAETDESPGENESSNAQAEGAEEAKADENTKAPNTKQHLTYKNLADLRDEIEAAPELPLEHRNVDSKTEVLTYLRGAIDAMVKKGYAPSAIADFLNERQSSYKFNKSEIRKLLSEMPPPKKKRGRPKESQPKEEQGENSAA